MTDAAAIKATFSDFQLVKTRKLAKLIFEVPIEEAAGEVSKMVEAYVEALQVSEFEQRLKALEERTNAAN